jgi:hypothetical protein
MGRTGAGLAGAGLLQAGAAGPGALSASVGRREALLRLRDWVVAGELPSPLDDHGAVAFVAAAERQGMAPLLDEELVRARPAWAPAVAERLRSAHRASLAISLQQLAAAARVLQLLGGAGVKALPLKGVAVAEALYDSPAHRPMADVDVLVLEGWDVAVEALSVHGYTLFLQADHAHGFVDPATGDSIELHHSVTSCPGLLRFHGAGLWERRREGGGLVEWIPGVIDGLLVLASHVAFQHGLAARLSQYLDLRRILERDAPDPDALLEAAEEAGVLSCLDLALQAARILAGAPVSEALNEQLSRRRTRGQRSLLARVRDEPERWLTPHSPALARVRWEACPERRGRLVALTLAPPPPGGFGSAVQRFWSWLRAVPRAARLAWAALRAR